jgi:hypothetical protein
MNKYKLPDFLGGGECVLASELSNRTVIATVPGHGNTMITLPLSLLTEIKPKYLEPPQGAGVLATIGGEQLVCQRYKDSASGESIWHIVGERVSYTWDDLCQDSEPVRLHPMPAVPLPWDNTESRVRFDSTVTVDHGDFRVLLSTAGRVGLAPTTARLVAAALWTAADAISRQQEGI